MIRVAITCISRVQIILILLDNIIEQAYNDYAPCFAVTWVITNSSSKMYYQNTNADFKFDDMYVVLSYQ